MITEKEIVKFRGDYYCIGLYRDDYSGNDTVFLRKLKLTPKGYEMKHLNETYNLNQEVFDYDHEVSTVAAAKAWYKETNGRYR